MKTRLLLTLILLQIITSNGQIAFSLQDRAFINSTSSLRKNLEGYWRLGEATGTTRFDDSKNGVHLTSNNNVTQQTGKVNNCAGFVSASTQYLSAANTNQVQFTISTPFTLSAWVNLTNNAASQTILSKLSAGAARGYILESFTSGNPLLYIASSAGAYRYLQGTTSITNQAWHFIVGTHDGSGTTSGMAIWVDGTKDTGATTGAGGSLTDIDNIGVFEVGAYTGNGALANGLIDEVGVWSRVLTTNEIGQLYNAGLGTHFSWAHK